MADSYGPTFGGYANVTGIIAVGPAAELVTEIAKLKALIPDPTQSVSAVSPEFDAIHPRLAEQLRAEIDAFAAAVAAAPTA